MFRFAASIFALLLTLSVVQTAGAQSAEDVRKALDGIAVRLCEGKVTSGDVAACQRIGDLATSETAKRASRLLAAQCQRMAFQRPDWSLEIALPFIVSDKEFESWSKENRKSLKSNDKPKAADFEALVRLPGIEAAKITPANACFSVEVAACLTMLDKPDAALRLLAKVPPGASPESRCAAAELKGDLLLGADQIPQSVDAYHSARNIAERLATRAFDPTRGERYLAAAELKYVKNRIDEKYEIAVRMQDTAKTSESWLTFRNAHRLLLADKEFEAYAALSECLLKGSDNAHTEAAEYCLVDVLCKLASVQNDADRQALIKRQRDDIDMARQRLATATHQRAPPALLAGYRDNLASLEHAQKATVHAPTGSEALEQAEKLTSRFLHENQFGLCRGEMMLRVGECYLVDYLDTKKAEPWLTRSLKWFEDAEKHPVAPTSKPSQTSPTSQFRTDSWGNRLPNEIEVGVLPNRRDCPWYLGAKREEAALWTGFLQYASGNYDQARTTWESVKSNPSIFARLMWNLGNQPGCLVASPKELESFKEKDCRLAVLLADFLYETERPQAALPIYRRFESGRYGKLSKSESAYIAYAIFACLCWDENADEIAYIEPKLKLTTGTPTAARCAFGYANRLCIQNDPKQVEKGVRGYDAFAKASKSKAEKDLARYLSGLAYERLAFEATMLGEERIAEQLTAKAASYNKSPKGGASEISAPENTSEETVTATASGGAIQSVGVCSDPGDVCGLVPGWRGQSEALFHTVRIEGRKTYPRKWYGEIDQKDADGM